MLFDIKTQLLRAGMIETDITGCLLLKNQDPALVGWDDWNSRANPTPMRSLNDPTLAGWDDWNYIRLSYKDPFSRTQPAWAGWLKHAIPFHIFCICIAPARMGWMIETLRKMLCFLEKMTQPAWAGMIETQQNYFLENFWSDPARMGWDDWNYIHKGIRMSSRTQPEWADDWNLLSIFPFCVVDPARKGWWLKSPIYGKNITWYWPSPRGLGWLKHHKILVGISDDSPSPQGRDDWNSMKETQENELLSPYPTRGRMIETAMLSLWRTYWATQPARAGMIEMRKYIQHVTIKFYRRNYWTQLLNINVLWNSFRMLLPSFVSRIYIFGFLFISMYTYVIINI